MKKKMFILTLCLLSISSPTIASAHNNSSEISTNAVIPGIQLYGNQTGYKYATVNGRICKRLWSYTYCRWEDPAWIPI